MGTYTLQYTGQEVDEILGSTEELSTRVTELDEDLSSRMADLEGALDSIPENTPIAGIVYPFAGDVVPEGFLLCDGAEYSRDDYAELFAAIGTTYGEGDGSSTFNVPDLKTRVPVGASEDYALGETGGEETHTLTEEEMPSHSHNFEWSDGTGTSGKIPLGTATVTVDSWDCQPTGGDQPHNNMQPYTVVNYIVSTGKSADARPMTVNETTVQSSAVAGMVYPFAGEGNPEGFLLCDGSAYSRTEYAKLFDAIGTTYGEGDGSTTFNVPNLESRVIIGESDSYALGVTGGEEKHTLTVDEMPSHSHEVEVYGKIYDGTTGNAFDGLCMPEYGSNINNNGEVDIQTTGGSQPHNNMQPYIVMRYFISTGEGSVISGGSSGAVEGGIIPADYIVEWAEEDDGWYWEKWASGRAYCEKTIEVEVTGWSAGGSLYYTNEDVNPVSFPFEFAEAPRDWFEINKGPATAFLVKRDSYAATTTQSGTRYIARGSSTDAAGTFEIAVKASGWWKEPTSNGGVASGAIYGINPADYITEYGQTGEWTWRKYASGIAECWLQKTFTCNNTDTFGSMFTLTTMLDPRDYPFEFIEDPKVIPMYRNINADYQVTPTMIGGTTTKSPTIQAIRPNDLTAAGSKVLEWTAGIMVSGFIKELPESGGTAVGYFDNATVENDLEVGGSIVSSGNPVYGAKVLYDNASGTSGTITLAETAANFAYIDIMYAKLDSDSGGYNTCRVYNPDGKRASFDQINGIGSATTYQLVFSKIVITGTTITWDLGGCTLNIALPYGGSPSFSGGTWSEGKQLIYKIIGYR